MKRGICVICGKNYNSSVFWTLEKFWLRLTEQSLLWENCCSEECYENLLEGLLSGKYKINWGKQEEGKS